MPITAMAGDKVALRMAGKGVTAAREVAIVRRRRRVSYEAGRAIEMLGHAIEYLTDELALELVTGESKTGPEMHPRVRAIELLMKCNREVYFSCPLTPNFDERVGGWLRMLLGWERA